MEIHLMNSINDYLLLEISKFLTINDIFELLLIDKYRYQLLNNDNIWKILLNKLLIESKEEGFDAYKIFGKSTYKETFWFVKDMNALKKINRYKTFIEIWNLRDFHLGYNPNVSINKNVLKQIFSLTNLHKLSLGYKQIISIPPQIASLTNLRELELTCDQIEEIPPQIGLLT